MSTHIGSNGIDSDNTGSHEIGPGDTGLLGREHEKALVTALPAGLPRGGRVLHLSGAAGTHRVRRRPGRAGPRRTWPLPR